MHIVTDAALSQLFPPPPPPPPPPAPTPPDDGRALYVQGLTALRDNDTETAIPKLTQALRRQPTHQGIHRNLVRALLLAERYDQVLCQAEAALSATPDDAELNFARGTALNALGHPARACVAFAHALARRPDHAASWLNMGNASADLDDLTSAEALCREAIRVDRTLAEAHASLGYILTRQGRIEAAITACEAAIHLRPDFAHAHWNLATAALLSGDLQRGFAEYEWRKLHPRYRSDFPRLPGPAWDGADPAGKTILVRAEQGFGDAIQFARYLPSIRASGGSPILLCAPALVPLIGSMPGVEAVTTEAALPPYDQWIDQASLPRLFGTTLETVPASHSYLRADPNRVRAWHARLAAGMKIGVAFTGNPKHGNDRRRSIPADLIGTLPNVPGTSFVNLGHGPTARGLGLEDLTPLLTDYAETAALIETLDLVVTVDTSVAHLAGALGKPVWILLPQAPDWRWLLGRTDSPWYRSARLFRQPTQGDWASVLTQVMDRIQRNTLRDPID
jgi:Flp pilus assembly protein TadD